MLTITDAAADAIRGIVEANDLPAESGLRITATEQGDDVAIDIDFVEAPETGDDTVEAGGARVFLDPQASQILGAVQLDVEEHGDHVHFQFADRDGEG